MVDRQLRAAAFATSACWRHEPRFRARSSCRSRSARSAYRDDPIQIGYGQTISQPYMTALMAQELRADR